MSHIYAFIILSPILVVLVENSTYFKKIKSVFNSINNTPIVGCCSGKNESFVNLDMRHVFPTPESPLIKHAANASDR